MHESVGDSGQPLDAKRRVACPRCRYDLRGASAEWIESCPIDGRCPECGLTLRWSELLGVALPPSAWLFEYAPRRRLALAWLCTIAATLLAIPLWRGLEMRMPWRPWRLVGMVFTVPLALLLLIHLANVGVAAATWWSFASLKANSQFLRPSPTAPPNASPTPGAPSALPRPPSLLIVLGESLLMPLAGKSHATVMVNGVAVPYPAPISVATSLGDRSSPLKHHRHVSFGLWDFRAQSVGPTRGRGWTIEPAPFNTAPGFGPPPSPIQGAVRLASRLFTEHGVAIAGAVLLQSLLVPSIFSLLPQTRRRCKVSWDHIARVALYSLIPMLLLLGALPLRTYLVVHLAPASEHRLGTLLATMSVLPALVLMAWWSIAIWSYLRMPHALGIAATATTIAVILSWLLFPMTAMIPLIGT